MFALALPAVLATLGVATDFAIYNMKQTRMQSAADQAAVAGARELALSSSDKASVQGAAINTAHQYMDSEMLNLDVAATIDQSGKQVRVTVTETWTPFFAHFIGADVTPIVVNATAGLFGVSKVCVLALETSSSDAIALKSDASLLAEECAVYSNSSHKRGVSLGYTSTLEARLVCSAGGLEDKGSMSSQRVVTECPPIADPLADRKGPTVGSCDFTDLKLNKGTTTLNPGVYCGGLKITGSAVVNLNPGEYIIKDGDLLAQGNATLQGNDVAFYLTGEASVIRFKGNAVIDLSGRETGPLAGMLLFDDPSETDVLRRHEISATRASNLTGTIYLPHAKLLIDPASKVAEKSAYTAIVVKKLIVENGPTLVLNSDYNKTPVPVPAGIKAGADVMLVD